MEPPPSEKPQVLIIMPGSCIATKSRVYIGIAPLSCLYIILEHKRNALVHYSIDLWNPGTNLNYFIDATMEASKESNITDLVVDVAG